MSLYNTDKERFAKLFSKYTGIKEDKIIEFLKENSVLNLIENTTSLGITARQLKKVNELKELSGLYKNLKSFHKEYSLSSTELSQKYFINYFEGTADKEYFAVAFLNNQNKVITTKTMFTGTINEAPVYPRELLKEALMHNAANIILAHNHPTGNLKPSSADIEVTRQIMRAAQTLKITVCDHIIVGKGKALSFAEEGLLSALDLNTRDTRAVYEQYKEYAQKIKQGNYTKEDVEKFNQLQADQLKRSLDSLKASNNTIKQYEQDLTR